ncbi:PREDICTED: O-acyltransferase WSD1 [Tarenaya hassleriana]|uniref:O-acyltransferase WSD1 n=1 Tax=Tarenaya hassleriana TaxID=28532 RepID=UPI00053C9967|nr:PREDICTED: O-acyltransferase WSD1 [Tarenaya hassleriana]
MDEPLSPVARLLHAPGMDCCIISVVGCKTNINTEVIINGLKETIVKHPRFSSKLEDGCERRGKEPRWIPTNVNVEDHVTVPDIDPERIPNPEQFIEDYVAQLTTIPLDTSRPLWDIHILNLKTSEAEAFGIVRSHHSLGDGMSLMSLILAFTRKTSDPEALPRVPVLKRRPPPDRNKNWFLSLALSVWSGIRLVWNTVEDVFLFLATAWFLTDTETSLKGGADTARNLKKFAHRIVAMDDIILIKNAMKMTINDVLLGVTQAAVSSYLNRLYDKKNEEVRVSAGNSKILPGKTRLRASVLVNLRPETGIQPLADMMAKGSKCRWGNYISYILLPLSISLQNTPLDHLLKAKSAMDRKKNSLQASLMYSSIDFFIHVLGFKVVSALTHRVVSNTTMSISNIVGPVEEISFYGHPIEFFAPSVYGHPQALTIHFQSYANKMIISIAVDPTVVPDPHELCDEMMEALNTIKASAQERVFLKNVN